MLQWDGLNPGRLGATRAARDPASQLAGTSLNRRQAINRRPHSRTPGT